LLLIYNVSVNGASFKQYMENIMMYTQALNTAR